jgi:hypothetical protein
VIRFRFGHEDLVRTRCAISPLFDLTWSTDILRDPAGHSLHLPWARAARERLEGFDYTLLDLLATSVNGDVPDFIAPPPTTRWPSSTTSSRAYAPRRPSAWRSRRLETGHAPSVRRRYAAARRDATGRDGRRSCAVWPARSVCSRAICEEGAWTPWDEARRPRLGHTSSGGRWLLVAKGWPSRPRWPAAPMAPRAGNARAAQSNSPIPGLTLPHAPARIGSTKEVAYGADDG